MNQGKARFRTQYGLEIYIQSLQSRLEDAHLDKSIDQLFVGADLGRIWDFARHQRRRPLTVLNADDVSPNDLEACGVYIVKVKLVNVGGHGQLVRHAVERGLKPDLVVGEEVVAMSNMGAEIGAHAVASNQSNRRQEMLGVLLCRLVLVPNVGKIVVPLVEGQRSAFGKSENQASLLTALSGYFMSRVSVPFGPGASGGASSIEAVAFSLLHLP